MNQQVQQADFKVSIDAPSEIDRSINIEIPRKMYDERFERALRQVIQNAHIKGFRPGRAPRAVVQRLYGERIHSDVLGELVSSAYQDAVKEHALRVVGYPAINIDGERGAKDDFKVTAAVSVIPEPVIKDYRGIEYHAEQEIFDDGAVELRIQSFLESMAEVKPLEDRDTAKTGDLVQVDFDGVVEGEPFPGSSAKGRHIELGSDKFPAALESGIAGMKIGETRSIDVTLTEEQGPEFAGKIAHYLVTLGGIFSKTLPSFDDEFAKKSGIAENAAEMRRKIEQHLEREVAQKNRTVQEDQYFKAVLAKNDFKVPQSLIDEEVRNYLFQMGLMDPGKEESYRYDVSAFREHLGEQAEFRVRRVIAMTRIIAQESHTAEKEQVEAWLEEQAKKKETSRAEIDQVYNFPEELERLQDLVARQTMMDKLLSGAKLVPGDGSSKGAAEAKAPKKKKSKKED